MNPLKRKQDDTSLPAPPTKKIKLNTEQKMDIDKEQYKIKKNKILEDSEKKICDLQKEIEKEKNLREDRLNLLDKEFAEYLQKNKIDETIEKPELEALQVHFASEQNATNNMIEEDFTTLWHAELRCEYDMLCGSYFTTAEQSELNEIKMKNTFPELDIDGMEENNDHFIFATAKFRVIQTYRLCNTFGLQQLFTVLDAPSQETADLMQIMDMENCGAFKYKKINNSNNLFDGSMSGMNEGGEHQNIILISRVEVNKHFKGKQYGRCLVQRITDNFGVGQCRVVLKPFPLQWERVEDTSDDHKKQFEEDRRKVISVWESMGFTQICDSAFWGRNQAYNHPMDIFE
eukprot:250704_1